jgi:hypothetical protein
MRKQRVFFASPSSLKRRIIYFSSPVHARSPSFMPLPAHRRTASELDMSSIRRISDALLLAQNRARFATDRANQAEQYEPQRLHLIIPQKL